MPNYSIVPIKLDNIMYAAYHTVFDPSNNIAHTQRSTYAHVFSCYTLIYQFYSLALIQTRFFLHFSWFVLPSFCIVWFVKQFSLYKCSLGNTMYPSEIYATFQFVIVKRITFHFETHGIQLYRKNMKFVFVFSLSLKLMLIALLEISSIAKAH